MGETALIIALVGIGLLVLPVLALRRYSQRPQTPDAILRDSSVIDHGPGIDESSLARIFGPFFTTKSHGTGLGLAISRSIVEAHRGQLRHRPTPGGGATFCFSLPLHATEAA